MAIDTVAASSKYVKPTWQGIKTFVRDFAQMTIGTEMNNVFTDELHLLIKGGVTKTGEAIEEKGFTTLKKDVGTAWIKAKEAVKDKSLWTTIKDTFKTMGDEFKGLKDIPKFLGKGGKLAETGKILFKGMPLIGNILMVACEMPNIIKAFTDKKDGGGIGTGLIEILRAGIKMAGFVAGMTLGTVLFGPIGGIVGGIAGQWLTDKLVGKSFSETAAEKEAKGQTGTSTTPAQPSTSSTATTSAAAAASTDSTTNPFAYSNLGFAPKKYTADDYRTRDLMSLGLGIA